MRLSMPGKAIENRLPSLPLLFDRMSRLTVERDANVHAVRIWPEFDGCVSVAE
jgi:hypothetical protein